MAGCCCFHTKTAVAFALAASWFFLLVGPCAATRAVEQRKQKKQSLRASLWSSSVALPRQLYYGRSSYMVPFNNNCTALVGVGIDPNDALGEDQTFLACETQDGSIYKFKGVCKEWIHDYIRDNLLVSSASKIILKDAKLDGVTDEIVVAQFPPTFGTDPGTVVPKTLGNRTVLVVRVETIDAKPRVTEQQILDSLFGTGGAPVNLKSQFAKCSKNKFQVFPAETRTALLGGLVPKPQTEEDEDEDEPQAVRFLAPNKLYKKEEEEEDNNKQEHKAPAVVPHTNGRSLQALASKPPKLKYLSDYLLVGTCKSDIGSSVVARNGDLGADIIVLSQPEMDDNVVNLDTSLDFITNTGSMWMDFDNKTNSRPDFLPGASRLMEGVSWTGDFALTSPSAKVETSNVELYGHVGIATADATTEAAHEGSRFYPFGIGNGIRHDFHGSRDLYRALSNKKKVIQDMAKFRQELRNIEAWVTDLVPEVTLRPGQNGLTGNGIANVNVLEMNVDNFDIDGDGVAVIDVDLNGNDFLLSNTNWIIESENKTFAIFRLLGDTNLVATRSTIMSGDGIYGNARLDDLLYNTSVYPRVNQYKLRVLFVKAQQYRKQDASISNVTSPGESSTSTDQVFRLTNTVVNGVGFYDLTALRAEGDDNNDPNDEGTTSISLRNTQGCTQLVAPQINLDTVRLDLCSGGSGFGGKAAWAGTGCKKKGVGSERATKLTEAKDKIFSGCPPESFRCSAVGATSNEFALAAQLGQTNQSSVTITCQVQGVGAAAVRGGGGETRRVLLPKLPTTAKVKVDSVFADHWFQFEILTGQYFISKIFFDMEATETPNVEFWYKNNGKYVINFGGTIKTGVLMTPSMRRNRNYVDLRRIDMCVVPRDLACSKPYVPKLSDAAGENLKEEEVLEGGVFTVKIPNTVSEGDSILTNEVTEELVGHFGVSSPSELADFVVYCLPNGAMNRTSYAYVNSWLSVVNDTACSNLNMQMREIGHNLGLANSRVWDSTTRNYWISTDWDTTGVMGGNLDEPPRCFNAAKNFQLGWFDPTTHTLRLESKPESITLSDPVLHNPAQPGQITTVKLSRSSPFDIYVMCRIEFGENRVVLAGQGAQGVRYSESYQMAELSPGETFYQDGYFDGLCGVNVTVTSIDAGAGTCNVELVACPGEIPTVQPTPPVVTWPTTSPTTPQPTTSCIPLDGVCKSEEDCCNNGVGACIKEDDNYGFNVKIVCKDSVAVFIDPLSYPGTCDDNGICEYGETCFSCPHDCNSLLFGPPEDRYCCDGYLLERPPEKAGPRTPAPTAAPTENCRLINMDFSQLERGEYVSEQLMESSGIRFSAMGKANTYCWTPNSNDLTSRAATYGAVRVFDTWIPTGGTLCQPSEGDLDLGSPNQYCKDSDISVPPFNKKKTWRKPGYGIGGAPRLGADGQPSDSGNINPYANCYPQGKALVIQSSNKTCPDECEYGGLFKIQFPYTYGANVTSITLLNLNRSPRIQMWTEHNGRVRNEFLANPGQNSVLVVPINTANVRSIVLSLYGTGALGSIEYRWCQEYTGSGVTALLDNDNLEQQEERDDSDKEADEDHKKHARKTYQVNKFSIKPNDPRCAC